ncbi:MAG: preprotein translocase subunit SecE [Eubacteriales bacterium]|nr:preprotein translocase subunit SecE [Eubacteriales bacterium]
MSNEEKASRTPRAPKVKFFAGVKAEFQKIIWPDKNTLLKQSVAVVIASIVMGVIIACIDIIAQYGVNFLTK